MKQFEYVLAVSISAVPALTLSAPVHAAEVRVNWGTRSIYQIITDRFYDGDPSNNNADGNYDPSGHRGTSVHGGDFKGIEQKLDYIKALGADAIWVSPVVLNARGEFHGYAGRDFYKVDPHWGSLADLQHMVQAAHARGILVIDDVVVNHGGNLIDSADSGYGKFKMPPAGYILRYRDPSLQFAPPFDLNSTNKSLTDLFHNNGFIQDYNNPTQSELGELNGLDDFRTESGYVRMRMMEIYQFWIEKAGFDGFRVDTVKHVEMGFWQTWCPAVRAFAKAHDKPDFFMFGEVLDGSDAKCGSYTGTQAGGAFAFDSTLDYPLYFKANAVLARASAATKQLADRYSSQTNYHPSARSRLVTFLDNHDQPRFLSAANANNNIARLKNALVFLYTSVGVPCLYYGTEQGFNGGDDPYDREDMFAGQFEQGPSLGDNFNMTHVLFQWVARLNNLRRLYPALQTGIQSILVGNPAGPGLFAYTRRAVPESSLKASAAAPKPAQEILVVLNTSTNDLAMVGSQTVYPAGTPLVNLLDPSERAIVAAGQKVPPITVPGESAKMFIALSQVLPLDPVVTAVMPAHDSTNGETAAQISLRFSQPMDTATVESAFSTVPAAKGLFSWFADHQMMTFSPEKNAWPAQTQITVRLAATARSAVSTNSLFAPFESRFKSP